MRCLPSGNDGRRHVVTRQSRGFATPSRNGREWRVVEGELIMKIPSVKNSFQAVGSLGKDALLEIPKMNVAGIADRFSPPSVTEAVAKRLGRIPAITFPGAQDE